MDSPCLPFSLLSFSISLFFYKRRREEVGQVRKTTMWKKWGKPWKWGAKPWMGFSKQSMA
ncbi:hypothetical protein CV_0846 [Chromobacterium violaceum ATCC 12472]|uniref:Uncharacterized protein n=1 Tax=Chromobacterium violaceum (strain ATCC 12472 / DSM 30191 / JCM 1249 / CCUG 213 / NBRC 12614 / NCIMB 9131 / NCTC 9757 / MK) TaxID=243365 RepID=Q7NZS5_CHRVO|nr:hypothetical protein CV_0846 [Chromobacterium violaceum ATCC 12472]